MTNRCTVMFCNKKPTKKIKIIVVGDKQEVKYCDYHAKTMSEKFNNQLKTSKPK